MKNKALYKEAKKRLFESGKLVCVFLGVATVIFGAVCALIVSDILSLALADKLSYPLLASIIYAAIALWLAFITTPLFLGYMSLLYSIYKGEREVYFIDIFASFAPKRYFKSLWFGLRFLLRGCFTCLLSFLIADTVYLVMCEAFKGMYFESLSVLFKAPAVVIFLFFYLLFSLTNARGFLGVFYYLDGVKHPYRASKKALDEKVIRSFWLKITFVLLAVLSVLSVGMLLLVAVPMMAFAYFNYAQKIIENINE